MTMLGFNTLYAKHGNVQCEYGKRRSQSDIFRIARHYKPGLRYLEFIESLKRIVKNNEVFTHNCPNIKARVFFLEIVTIVYT